MARPPRSKSELEQAFQEDVCYEFNMLAWTHHELSSGKYREDSPEKNCLMESHAIHLRNAIEFLYSRNPREDIVIAEDYLPDWQDVRPPEPATRDEAFDAASVQINHLTYKRNPATKMRWPHPITTELLAAFREFVRRTGMREAGTR